MALNQSNIYNTIHKSLVDAAQSQIGSKRLSRALKFISGVSYYVQSTLGCSAYSWSYVEKRDLDDEFLTKNDPGVSADDESLCREDAEMVMERLGFFCNPESEGLGDRLSSNEVTGLFNEKEPSLEEVKEAFNVFDENKDGFIDARELQRVLCILGLKEGSNLENCKKMIGAFDRNSDGRIDFNEFVKFMENSFC